LVYLLVLLAGVLACNFLLVRRANLDNARRVIDAELHAGAQVFDRLLSARLEQLLLGARLMADDWAFRRLYGGTENFEDPVQRRTLVSALENYRARMPSAAFFWLLSLDDTLLADTAQPELATIEAFAHPEIIRAAEESEDYTATAFAELDDGSLALLMVVPILLPDPSGWIVAGFRVDADLAEEMRRLTRLEVSFVGEDRIFTSTLQPDIAKQMEFAKELHNNSDVLFDLEASGETWIGVWKSLPAAGSARGLLQRSLSEELEPFRQLEHTLLMLTIAAVLISALLALWLAAGISRPVRDLTEGVKRIEQGRYSEPVPVTGRDELAALASAFNGMALGLVERDRVRDLLGKHVSPEIAAELLRRPAALGGELREVTVMFTDLRGFTSLSERLEPVDLLDLLNEYFTVITHEIEAHGGVVDKYIGDSVMAVFGAPLDMPDHARKAVECSRALCATAEKFNVERATRDLPPLGTGIGVASGIVIAGNMGSESRHNYTVIGDAVNLAARLQDQTKVFGVPCIIAGTTAALSGLKTALRDLGPIAVRGKAGDVRGFALT